MIAYCQDAQHYSDILKFRTILGSIFIHNYLIYHFVHTETFDLEYLAS